VCRNIACTHVGGRKIVGALEERLGIDAGGTTPDGKFSLEAAECLATCDGAPSIQINYEDFYNVTPESAVGLIESLERGEEVRSVRGQPVKSSKQIARETATAGVRRLSSEMEELRTIGGETPRADTAPGHRPPEKGNSSR
jgi:NADH-quinone oxidoreductase subunit E